MLIVSNTVFWLVNQRETCSCATLCNLRESKCGTPVPATEENVRDREEPTFCPWDYTETETTFSIKKSINKSIVYLLEEACTSKTCQARQSTYKSSWYYSRNTEGDIRDNVPPVQILGDVSPLSHMDRRPCISDTTGVYDHITTIHTEGFVKNCQWFLAIKFTDKPSIKETNLDNDI